VCMCLLVPSALGKPACCQGIVVAQPVEQVLVRIRTYCGGRMSVSELAGLWGKAGWRRVASTDQSESALGGALG
jgi:hypothetical protein